MSLNIALLLIPFGTVLLAAWFRRSAEFDGYMAGLVCCGLIGALAAGWGLTQDFDVDRLAKIYLVVLLVVNGLMYLLGVTAIAAIIIDVYSESRERRRWAETDEPPRLPIMPSPESDGMHFP